MLFRSDLLGKARTPRSSLTQPEVVYLIGKSLPDSASKHLCFYFNTEHRDIRDARFRNCYGKCLRRKGCMIIRHPQMVGFNDTKVYRDDETSRCGEETDGLGDEVNSDRAHDART